MPLLVWWLLFGLLPRMVLATDYFVGNSGEDTFAGTSPGAAWKSIARVNANSFQPGDRILFQANEEFIGNLRLDQRSAGRTNAPVVVSSFGRGRARLVAGRETGITIESAGCITISNLIVLGDGLTNNIGYGVLFDNRLDEFGRLKNVQIENVDVSGFGIFGVLISGKSSGFDHVRVIDCDLHDNLRGGMEVAGRLPWNSPLYAHADVLVSRCRAYHNTGDPSYQKNHSGSGLVFYQVDGGSFEDCQAWENGQLCHHANGGVGIWSCASRRVVIQHCESFDNRTSGGDGGGFDLDGGSIDCILQYNYSHGNEGPGLMVYTYPYASHSDKGCIVRFNISDNDSRGHQTYAGVWVRNDGNGIAGLRVYNNTIRIGPWSNQAVYVNGMGVEAEFRNNIFIGGGSALPLQVEQPSAKLRFVNDLYWADGAAFKIRWGERNYSSLADWRRETNQEFLDGKNLGVFADPELGCEASSKASSTTSDWRRRLGVYKPSQKSIAWKRGIAVKRDFSNATKLSDILGEALNFKRWPLGAIGFGSR